MGDITRTIAANSGQDVAAAGNYIFLKSASADVRVVLNQQSVHMQAGDRWDVPEGFKGFRIENETAGSITAELIVDRGGYFRSEVTGSVTITKGANIAISKVTAGVASGVLVAADSTRRALLVTNTSTTETVWIDEGVATAAGGFPLYPRQTLGIDASAADALNVIRGGAADVDLRILEEKD